MLPLFGDLNVFLKVIPIVFLDSLGSIIESIIQLVTDKMILNFGIVSNLCNPAVRNTLIRAEA
jgi:hypothetical protein